MQSEFFVEQYLYSLCQPVDLRFTFMCVKKQMRLVSVAELDLMTILMFGESFPVRKRLLSLY